MPPYTLRYKKSSHKNSVGDKRARHGGGFVMGREGFRFSQDSSGPREETVGKLIHSHNQGRVHATTTAWGRLLLPVATVVVLLLAAGAVGPADAQSAGLAAPMGVSAADDSLGLAVTVRWDPVGGASGYKVYRSGRSSFASNADTLIGRTGGTSFRDDHATAGKTLYYKVSAVDASGTEGGASAVASVAAADGMAQNRADALRWLAGQQEAEQGYRTVFDSTCSDAERCTVSGHTDGVATLPGSRIPSSACASGSEIDKDVVIVRLYSATDVDYLQEEVPLCSDGRWNSTKTLGTGKKIARLVKVSTDRALNSTEFEGANSYRGLIRSHYVPFDDPSYGYPGGAERRTGYRLEQRSWIYDDAVAVYAFSAAGQFDKAKAVLAQLQQLQKPNGSLVFSYDVYRGQLFDEYVRTGALAWVGGAALAYEEASGDPTYRRFAAGLADYVLGLQVTDPGDPLYGSIKGGMGKYTDPGYVFDPAPVPWASTEHNIDAYFFLRDLGYLTGNDKYSRAAGLVKQGLLNNHWNNAQNRFNQGAGDDCSALDVNTWGAIFLDAIGKDDMARTSLQYAENFRVNGQTIEKSSDPETYNMTYSSPGPINGYEPYLPCSEYVDPPTLVWAEGTWGAILAKMRLGIDASDDLRSMQRMQAADPRGGFIQVTKSRRSLPYEFSAVPAGGGTGWAALVMGDADLLWKPDGWAYAGDGGVDGGGNGGSPEPEPDPDLGDNLGPPANGGTTGGAGGLPGGGADGPSGNQSGVGDPVNVTTGNVYDVEEDLNIPGRGLPLQFVRFYNSQDTISKPMGHGWTHTYNTRLREKADGSVVELAPQGARLLFENNADGSYASPQGVFDVLKKNADGSYALVKKNGVEWIYAPGGKLRKVTDPNGNALSFAYDSLGRLATITDSAGRETALDYNGGGRLMRLTDPAGREVRYAYSEGDLVSATDPSGAATRYAYDADHNLVRSTNPDGGSTLFSYDAQDRAVSVGGEGGFQKITLSYEPANNRTLVTDSKGDQSVFRYDADERVTAIVDPYGKEMLYGWDARGNQTSFTDQLGNTTAYEYDAKGNLTKILQPKPTAAATASPTTTFSYAGPFSRLQSVTDPEGGVTRYAYDDRGNLASFIDALGNRTTFEYDASGQLVKSTDPKGNATAADPSDGATTFSYDASGNITSFTDPAGETTRLSYGGTNSLEGVLSLPASITDPMGRTTDLSYDALGRPTKVTHPAATPGDARASVSMAYDATGDLTSVTDERGNTSSYRYDATDQLVRTIDPLQKVTAFAYDAEGNLVSETNPAGTKTTYAYDKLGRLLKVSSPDGTTNADGTPGTVTHSYAYDAAGRTTAHVDPKGQKTAYDNDALGNLVAATDLNASGAVLQKATYAYDLMGRMTKATNPNGHGTSYSYDALGNLLKETDPLGNATTYAYDENGNTKSRADAMGRTTTYSYDALGRPLTATYPDGSKVQSAYDAAGNLTSVSDKTGTTAYAYDGRDRLVKETLPGGKALSHGYDAAGNRTSLSYPDGGKVLYEYDAADRLASVTDRAGAQTNYSYDALGRPTKVAYPSGAADAYSYDPLGRVTRTLATDVSSTGTTVALSRLLYAYDDNSNPTSITNKAGEKYAYTYDALDRLTKEAYPDRTLSYAYDPAGNRKSVTRDTPSTDPVTTSYAYDAAERMLSAGATDYAYNKNGEMVSKTSGTTTTNYAYDFEGMMTKAGTKTFKRDAFGRVASSTVGTTTTDYFYDGADVAQETTGTTPTFYARGLGGELVNRRGGGEPLSYFHHDAIGSVVALSNASGDLTDAYSYTAFGGLRSQTGTSKDNHLYLGAPLESTSGLYDLKARMYEPGTGRFTSEDPVAGFAAMPETLNPYAYGYDNPLGYPDPNGDCPICLVAGAYLLKNAAQSASFSAGEYYLTHRADKGGIDWMNFGRTVGYDAVTGSINPLGGVGKAGKILSVAKGAKPPSLSPLGAGRSGAFRQAKRDAGIPVGQHPSEVLPNYDRRGNLAPGRVYKYDRPPSHGESRPPVEIRDDAAGHNYGPNDPQNRGPHFNLPGGGHYDY